MSSVCCNSYGFLQNRRKLVNENVKPKNEDQFCLFSIDDILKKDRHIAI